MQVTQVMPFMQVPQAMHFIHRPQIMQELLCGWRVSDKSLIEINCKNIGSWIWIILNCCVQVKAGVQKTRLVLCCHHSGWDIVLQAHATQKGNLESWMSTSMNSNGFSLISSGTIMWNMYDGLPSTWLKFVKLHKKSRQSLRRQVQLPDSRMGKANITCCPPVGVEYK